MQYLFIPKECIYNKIIVDGALRCQWTQVTSFPFLAMAGGSSDLTSAGCTLGMLVKTGLCCVMSVWISQLEPRLASEATKVHYMWLSLLSFKRMNLGFTVLDFTSFGLMPSPARTDGFHLPTWTSALLSQLWWGLALGLFWWRDSSCLSITGQAQESHSQTCGFLSSGDFWGKSVVIPVFFGKLHIFLTCVFYGLGGPLGWYGPHITDSNCRGI